jgi:DNA polymerase-3 subunit alpha
MTAVLTAESGDVEKIAEIIAECTRMNIPVLSPDVNESFGKFTVIKAENERDDKIRFGLETIKNVGVNVVAAIIEARAEKPFKSIADFIERIHHKDLNKKSLESLIKAGALDSLGERNLFLLNLDYLLNFSKEIKQAKSVNQSSIFDTLGVSPTLKLKPAEPASVQQKLAWEKELLGLYVSSHPLVPYKEQLDKKAKPIKDLLASSKIVAIGGILTGYRKIITKNGKQMVFAQLQDSESSIEVVVFPDTFEKNPSIWQSDAVLLVKGQVQLRDNSLKLICKDATLLT